MAKRKTEAELEQTWLARMWRAKDDVVKAAINLVEKARAVGITGPGTEMFRVDLSFFVDEYQKLVDQALKADSEAKDKASPRPRKKDEDKTYTGPHTIPKRRCRACKNSYRKVGHDTAVGTRIR